MRFTRLLRMVLAVSVFALIVWLLIRHYTATTPERLQAAEMKAQAFCNAISIGSDISILVSRAKAEGIFFGATNGYTFYFPATEFDKAVCEVKVDRDGKVLSKTAVMEYD
jgi:hypothetical protein